MKIVADSSPLITLAKIAQLEILPRIYRSILITPEVYGEVAETGAGLTGAAEIAAAGWIEIRSLKFFSLSNWAPTPSLMDDRDGRRAAWKMGVDTVGCVGILEEAFRLELISDLRDTYRQLFTSGAFVSRTILEQSSMDFNLPPL